jgi:hypothetical protein
MNLLEDNIEDSFISELNFIAKKYDYYFSKKNNHINYINLFQKNLNLQKYDYLLNYLKKIKSIEKSISKNNILYYGLIVSQPNNDNQYYHIDYRGKSITYFIPLCDINDTNGTEYLYFYDNKNYEKYFNLFLNITHEYKERDDLIKFLETKNLFYKKDYELKIVNCKAYSLIHLPHNVFHRGKTNESGKKRIMFQLTLELEPINFIQNQEFIPIAEEDEKYD